ncbi:MAG: hypothetical protein EBY48_02960, partial [Opitutae bacterium]|nr:hypothetical protein [Opitutae bacterium]
MAQFLPNLLYYFLLSMTDLKEPSTASSKTSSDSNMVEDLKSSILRQLQVNLARSAKSASSQEVWTAVCLAVRERIMDR